MAVYPRAYVGLPLTADFFNKTQYDFTLKQSATSRTNTTTLAADPDLSGIALPVGIIHVRLMLLLSTGTGSNTVAEKQAPDLQVNWSFSGSASGVRGELGPEQNLTSNTATLMTVISGAMGTVRRYGSTSEFSQVIFEESFLTVTTAGTLSVNWAQNTASTAAATTINAGSFLMWKQVG